MKTLQEMLTTETPENITDAELKHVAYGLTYGQFDNPETQTRQWALQARLRKIEAAEKASKPKVSLDNLIEAYRDDSDDDEYEWS